MHARIPGRAASSVKDRSPRRELATQRPLPGAAAVDRARTHARTACTPSDERSSTHTHIYTHPSAAAAVVVADAVAKVTTVAQYKPED